VQHQTTLKSNDHRGNARAGFQWQSLFFGRATLQKAKQKR